VLRSWGFIIGLLASNANAGGLEAGPTKEGQAPVTAVVGLRLEKVPGKGKRVFLELTLENRGKSELKIPDAAVYSGCRIVSNAFHIFDQDGVELPYTGVMTAHGAADDGSWRGYQSLYPREKLVVRRLDISAAYRFPGRLAKLRTYWEGGGILLPGGWINIRSPDVVFEYAPITVGVDERVQNRARKTSTRGDTRTVYCEQR